ncbi:hypothetical protein Ancab_008966, partial [Ancistrocladus abbreviatus]
ADSWRWQIQWVRPLCEVEEGLEGQLLVLLAANHPSKASPDTWRWGQQRNEFFSVKKAYTLLKQSEQQQSLRLIPCQPLWRKDLPSKVIALISCKCTESSCNKAR